MVDRKAKLIGSQGNFNENFATVALAATNPFLTTNSNLGRPLAGNAPNATLLPHVGSASEATRRAMADLVVDNLAAWFATGRPLTPVPETSTVMTGQRS